MNDVFISYAHIDDQPMMEGQRGWISQFHRSLEVRMAQLLGQELKVWRDPKLQGSDLFDEALVRQFSDSKVLVSVLTPRYVRSEWCRRELEEFVRAQAARGGITAENKSRVFKVVKTPVAPQEIPAQLSDLFSRLLGFDFYEIDPETGKLREFDESLGAVMRQRFFERIYDLAHEMCAVLKALEPSSAPAAGVPASGRTVYLATTTLELQPERDKIRRELLERGHRVLPEAPLPPLSREIESVVKTCLAQSHVAVHLCGRHYGATPEDAAESVPALQLRWSAETARARELPRLIWLPGGEIADQRQRALVAEIQDHPQWHFAADLFEGNLTQLKQDLIQKLSPAEKKPAAVAPAAPAAAATGPARVYVICDAADETAVAPLEDFLFAQGVEVCLPAFDGGSAEADALHRDNLLGCDAVLVFYGSAPRAWVEIKLRELLKAPGYGRPQPITLQGVYLAPPFDPRKERFRSLNTQVIRGEPELAANADLAAFLAAVKGVRA